MKRGFLRKDSRNVCVENEKKTGTKRGRVPSDAGRQVDDHHVGEEGHVRASRSGITQPWCVVEEMA